MVKDKLRQEQISALPPALEIARDKERMLAAIGNFASEMEVRENPSALNERIRRVHFSCTWGPSCMTLPVDVEKITRQWSDCKGYCTG